MILVSDVIARIESALDAEGYDHYTFDRDYRYAISYAQEFLTSALDRVLGKTRFIEERLADLTFTGTWVTNNQSRFTFDEAVMGQRLWAIVAIYMNPVVTPTTAIAQPNPALSVYSDSHKYIKSYKSAWRVTAEEHSSNRNNPFAPGNEYHDTCEELREYGYLSPLTYLGVPTPVKEITITSEYLNKTLCMQYLKFPNEVTAPNQQLEFPSSMMDLIVNKSLAFISYKRGDTNLTMVTEADVRQLTNLLK